MTPYTEEYYKTKNYRDYIERGDRYRKMTEEIVDLFDKICLLGKNSTILDFGCGVGHMVKALTGLGYANSYGYDISEWAIRYGRNNISLGLSTKIYPYKYDLMIALDVFEHMIIDDIITAIGAVNPRYILFRSPVTKVDGGDYVLSTANDDDTHVLRLTKRSWTNLFSKAGYSLLFNLNLKTIWDSDGVMSTLFVKSE